MTQPSTRPVVDLTIPAHRAAWMLSMGTAHQLLRRAGAGHGTGLILVSLALTVLALAGPHWVLLLAALAAAAGTYLLRARRWGATRLYPNMLALVQAVGADRAHQVCARFVNDPLRRDLFSLEDGFASAVGLQATVDRKLSCGHGHRPLCAHRPPQPVPDCPPLMDVALYGPTAQH